MDTNRIFFVIGLWCATIAAISCLLAFALPSWIYTYVTDSQYGIDNAGLWEFCLDNFFDPRFYYNDGKPMYGCHWIYSDYLKEIRWTILNPDWYIAIQIMATINLILSFIALIGLYVVCCVQINNCPVVLGIVCEFFCTGLGFCEVVLYAIRVRDDEYYRVPNARSKSLGAGWGMAVVAFIFSMAAMLALTFSYLTVRVERRRLKRESMRSLERETKQWAM